MSITITVALGSASKSELIAAAQFILERAGYQAPERPTPAYDATPEHDELRERQSFTVGANSDYQAQANSNQQGAVDAALPPTMTVIAQDTSAPLPPAPPGIDVDAQGIPWDGRIHASSRAKIGDGTWRQKRNLDPEVYKQVMAELRQTMGIERRAPQPPAPPAPQAVFAAPPVPPVPAAPVQVEPEDDVTDISDAVEVPAPPAAAVVPPAPFVPNVAPPAPPVSSTPIAPVSAGAATGASPGDMNFPQLMQKITAAMMAKKIGPADITRAVQSVNLPALPMLASRPDLVGAVATHLGLAL